MRYSVIFRYLGFLLGREDGLKKIEKMKILFLLLIPVWCVVYENIISWSIYGLTQTCEEFNLSFFNFSLSCFSIKLFAFNHLDINM